MNAFLHRCTDLRLSPSRLGAGIWVAIGILAIPFPVWANPIYVSKAGKDANDGQSPTNAVATVSRALALASKGSEVRIAAGLYAEDHWVVPPGVTLSGGWDNTFADATRKVLTSPSLALLKPGADKCNLYTCLTNTQGDRVVTLRGSGGQILQQLIIIGPDLGARTDGASSLGVVVDGAPGVRLDFVDIEAGKGAKGVAGESRLAPVGHCVRGGQGGGGGYNTGQGDMWQSSCSAHPSSDGDSVTVNSVVVAKGGAGGAIGNYDCSWAQAYSGNYLPSGANGATGGHGIQGPAGAPAPSDPGHFAYRNGVGSDLYWIGNQGGRGSDGSHGAGGGGGAAGDNGNVLYWCLVSQPVLGGVGHNGGDGGCGGGGGGGGFSGGGAVALVVSGATVGSAGLVLFGGQGGDGGEGGSSADGTTGVVDDHMGSPGQTGKAPCWWSHDVYGGTGGAGGHGGDGGGGGGGAGGNGGPAISLVKLRDGAVQMDANLKIRTAGGRAGRGGLGGKGTQDANTAKSGVGNTQTDEFSVPLKVN